MTRRFQLTIKRFQEAIRKADKSGALPITCLVWWSVTESCWRKMNSVQGGKPVRPLLKCTYTECGATFSKQRKLKEHETVHTGAVRQRFTFPKVHNKCINTHKIYKAYLAYHSWNLEYCYVKLSTAAVSVHNCWLWQSFLQKIPPEAPHAPAQRSEAVQVGDMSYFFCRCPQPSTHYTLLLQMQVCQLRKGFLRHKQTEEACALRSWRQK